jgi:hypothetical protein
MPGLMRKETLDPNHTEKQKLDELAMIVNGAWNKAEELKVEKKHMQ